MPFKLNVLDQSPIPAGSTAGDALRNSLEHALSCHQGLIGEIEIDADGTARAIWAM